MSRFPVGVVVSGALETLITREMTLEAHNAQYLQRHPVNGRAILGAARGLQILGSPRDEIEGVVFGAMNPGVDLPLKVSQCGQFQPACELIAVVCRRHWMCGRS